MPAFSYHLQRALLAKKSKSEQNKNHRRGSVPHGGASAGWVHPDLRQHDTHTELEHLGRANPERDSRCPNRTRIQSRPWQIASLWFMKMRVRCPRTTEVGQDPRVAIGNPQERGFRTQTSPQRLKRLIFTWNTIIQTRISESDQI